MKEKSFIPFLVVWTGQFFSGLGTGMTAFALGVHVFKQTNNAMNFAMVMATLFIPAILIAPMGGVLADRFDRRLMIILGDAGSATAVAFLLLCTDLRSAIHLDYIPGSRFRLCIHSPSGTCL